MMKASYVIESLHDTITDGNCKQTAIDGHVVQRLVPGGMRKSLVSVIHKEECRHIGFDHVFQLIWKRFYWIGMAEDIREWLRVCASVVNRVWEGPYRAPSGACEWSWEASRDGFNCTTIHL